jgi:hypothetical protein
MRTWVKQAGRSPSELLLRGTAPISMGKQNLFIRTGAYPDFLLQALDTATYATLRKERRMILTDQTAAHRKSGVAEWRDLRFYGYSIGGALSFSRSPFNQ